MDKLIAHIKNGVDKLIITGFFSVFLSNVVCKIVSFFGGIIIVRVLSKNDYGVYSYIMNCYTMLFLLNDLGCNVAMCQFCSENHKDSEKFNNFFVFGYKKALLFTGITAVLILISPLFYPYSTEEAKQLTKYLFLIPFIVTTNTFLLSNARIRLKNNLFAKINIFSSVINYLVILPMSYYFGIRGALISNYLINIFIMIYSIYVNKDLLHFDWKKDILSKKEKADFLKLAIASQLNNGINSILHNFDIFFIGLIIADMSVISAYKVGMTIPAAMLFIPSSIMVYTVPYFARNKGNITWLKSNYIKLVFFSGVLNGLISVLCIIFAPIIIPIIFGKQYSDSVQCFIVLMIGYFFSATFKITSENIIYTQRKVKVNIIITIISGVTNCILDIIFIKMWGAIGAAYATMLVNIFSGIITFGYMCFYLRSANFEKTN